MLCTTPSPSLFHACRHVLVTASAPPPAPAAVEGAPSSPPGRLRPEDRRLAATRCTRVLRPSSSAHVLYHGRVLEHVRQDEEADLGAPDVDVLEIGHLAVPVRYRDLGHLTVHVVLGLDEAAPVHLPGVGLARHDVALGLHRNSKISEQLLYDFLCNNLNGMNETHLVKDLNRNTNRHICCCKLSGARWYRFSTIFRSLGALRNVSESRTTRQQTPNFSWFAGEQQKEH